MPGTTTKKTPARKLTPEQMTKKKQDECGKVAGYCPMGCGETLFLGTGGRVTCSYIGCPDPTVVDQLLNDEAKEKDHIVEIRNGEIFVTHPLRESVDDQVLDCKLHAWLLKQAELMPPFEDGTYRFTYDDEEHSWSYLNSIV